LLAQPSGVAALPGGGAVFVDAESSALRVLTPGGDVVTLVGQGLFDWGASDGGPSTSALQHPLGVAVGAPGDGGPPPVYVADTFNGLVREWRGSAWEAGAGALRALPASGLEEPGGVAVLPDGRLLATDANHHRVVLIGTDDVVPQPLAIDESWLGTDVGAPIETDAGEVVQAPFAVDLGSFALVEDDGPPVRVEVSSDPPSLLAPGPRAWAVAAATGAVEVAVTSTGGTGVLVVAVEARVADDGATLVRRSRTRHDLTVKSRVSLS
jgi:NHL repeat